MKWVLFWAIYLFVWSQLRKHDWKVLQYCAGKGFWFATGWPLTQEIVPYVEKFITNPEDKARAHNDCEASDNNRNSNIKGSWWTVKCHFSACQIRKNIRHLELSVVRIYDTKRVEFVNKCSVCMFGLWTENSLSFNPLTYLIEIYSHEVNSLWNLQTVSGQNLKHVRSFGKLGYFMVTYGAWGGIR